MSYCGVVFSLSSRRREGRSSSLRRERDAVAISSGANLRGLSRFLVLVVRLSHSSANFFRLLRFVFVDDSIGSGANFLLGFAVSLSHSSANFFRLLLVDVSTGSGANRRFVLVVDSTGSTANLRLGFELCFSHSSANFLRLFLSEVSTGSGANLRGGLESPSFAGELSLDDLAVVSIGSGVERRFVPVDVSIGSGANRRRESGFFSSADGGSLDDLAVVSIGSGAKRRLVRVVVSTGSGLKQEVFAPCTVSRASFEDFEVVSIGSTLNRLGGMVAAMVDISLRKVTSVFACHAT